MDWFTPTNHLELDVKDGDLNSSGASLIPGTHLVLGGGKEGILYVLDTRNVGHLGDEHARQHFKATASHIHSLVYWASTKQGSLLCVWGQRDKARVYRIDGEKVVETPLMTRDIANMGHPGAMLSLSADGNRNGILWSVFQLLFGDRILFERHAGVRSLRVAMLLHWSPRGCWRSCYQREMFGSLGGVTGS